MKPRLSQIGQSGATGGQSPVWNATTGQWEPATPAGSSDTGWLAPVFTNGWTSYAAPFGPVGYRKLNGVVFLRGLAQTGTLNTAIFTLPVGYRPTLNLRIPAIAADAFAQTAINATGEVVQLTASSNTWHSVMCSFIADQ